MKRVKIFLAAVLVMAAAGLAWAVCVYHGIILLNNPSKSRYPVRGVDVSHYQGEIDWPVLARQNIDFAYVKATEGSSHVDRKFQQNWEAMGKTGLSIGVYHFFSFDSPGKTQADNFIAQVERVEGMLAPVVDVEYYGDKKQNPPQPDALRRELDVFLNELYAYYGTVPVIYSTEDVWEQYLQGYEQTYPLWIRNVFTKPKINARWTFWQYTNRARLKGYRGDETFIDVNVFSGSRAEWEQWLEQNTCR